MPQSEVPKGTQKTVCKLSDTVTLQCTVTAVSLDLKITRNAR